jgi:hypothetical protein
MTMTHNLKNLMLGTVLALATIGVARADGDGGDNSMSQWTGESYAAFHRGEVGDFYTDPHGVAGNDNAKEASTQLAGSRITPRSQFRYDTAA